MRYTFSDGATLEELTDDNVRELVEKYRPRGLDLGDVERESSQ